MKEVPILFSTPMVQAILDGRKTQTRRVVKPQPSTEKVVDILDKTAFTCRYGKPGDLLWVRESWRWDDMLIGGMGVYRFKANYNDLSQKNFKWKPSIHMPKEAARIWLRVTDVRVERLKAISEDDAIAEGVEGAPFSDVGIRYKNYVDDHLREVTAKESFQSLWQSINGEESWEANPYVWVVEFKVISKDGKK